MINHPTASRQKQRGSVIILVLGTILLVSGLMTKFVAEIGTELIVSGRNSTNSQLRREAYSALETTLAVLAEFKAVDGALYAPAQGWSDPLGYAGVDTPVGMQTEISYVDETGKLSLVSASPDAIRVLLESSGIEPVKAQVAADAFLTWSRRAPPPLGLSGLAAIAPGRPLRTFDEFASIEGLRELITDSDGRPNEIWQRLERDASLYAIGRTNLNTASPMALHAMGWSQSQIAALQAARTQSSRLGYAETAEELTPLLGAENSSGVVGTQVEVLRVKVVVRSGGMACRLEAVISPRATSASAEGIAPEIELRYPFQILEFQENPEVQEHKEETI